jgi:hypothetical protein
VVTGNGSVEFSSITPDAGDSLESFLPVQGLVSGGQSRAVVGVKVYVMQVDSSGRGNALVSLLTSATGNPPDSIGYYARTGEFGGFSIAGDYTCTPGREIYLYAKGGNSGGDGSNDAIGLMASLGSCPKTGTFSTTMPFVVINAVTTVATAYAMAGIATDATHVSGPGSSPGSPADSASVVEPSDLVSVSTGFANATVPARPDSKVPRTKIHTLANILSSCINSSSSTSASCVTLFANARSKGDTGEIPSDTATAAINIARHPRTNVATLYRLQPSVSRPFLPSLESAPDDFTLSLAPENSNTAVASLSLHP